MKLINCKTGKIETEKDWVGAKTPPYAALSHTWATGEELGEVTFNDYIVGRNHTREKKNWTKIDKAVEIVRMSSQPIDHLWIDTCCIDKTDVSETSEAINSMFKWYSEAVICYAQVADFKAQFTNTDAALQKAQLSAAASDRLRNCRWFERAWTLQELIAPRRVEFLDMTWTAFGTRDGLSSLIGDITGIDQAVLKDPPIPTQQRNAKTILRNITVAKKMSWASSRRATKTEDTAYSLLGIFDVNMPLLYGEGSNAFIRLQEEILRSKNDLTLFAWQALRGDSGRRTCYRGVLAQEPDEFKKAGDVVLSEMARFTPDFSITNKGLKIRTQLRKMPGSENLFLSLNCCKKTKNPRRNYGIALTFRGAGGFVRTMPETLVEEPLGEVLPEKENYIALRDVDVDVDEEQAASPEAVYRKSFRFKFAGTQYYDLTSVSHAHLWYEGSDAFITHGVPAFSGCLFFVSKGALGEPRTEFIVSCGLTVDSQPWACIAKNAQKNDPIYNAAAAQDWNRMGLLGQKQQTASTKVYYTGANRYRQESGLHLTVSIDRLAFETDHAFHITIRGASFNDMSSCGQLCICCCTNQYQDDCIIL